MKRYKVTATVAADGTGTFYTPRLSGELCAIEYVKVDYADGVDFTITAEATTKTLWTESNVNAAKVCAPRLPRHSTAGVAELYASGGTAVTDRIPLANTRVKIAIAQGGVSKTATFHVLVD